MKDPVGLLSLLTCGWLTIEVLRQFLPLLKRLRIANTVARAEIPDALLPEVRVLLCLRGADPFLDRCLDGLARQDYPRYRIVIIVDSCRDEALPHALNLQQAYGDDRIEVMFRKYLFATCSRRASSLLSGLDELDQSVDAIVLCDGDTVPHKNWLRDLMRPLVLEGAKATSGNRWYVPESPTLGSEVRYLWNALAVPCMFQEGIIWAGSMAVSREVFRDPEFVKSMRLAFSEDTKLAGYLQNTGFRPVPQPDIPVINSESATLRAFYGFVTRQMLAAKLHHPSWSLIFRNAMLIALEMWILLPLAVYRGTAAMVPWLTGILIYGTVANANIFRCEWEIRKFVKTNREHTLSPFGWRRIILGLPAFATLAVVYPVAVLVAAFTKTHVWRGITYRVQGDGVRLAEPSLEPAAAGLAAESFWHPREAVASGPTLPLAFAPLTPDEDSGLEFLPGPDRPSQE